MSEARAHLRQLTRIGFIASFLGVGLVTVVGVPAASAHTGTLSTSGVCQSDGTRLVTYTGSTTNVPESGVGHTATLTVGEILPGGASVSPSEQTVVGNTSFRFTQTIPGDANAAQATAFLTWGDNAQSDPIGTATFTTDCTPQPAPIVKATSSDNKDCASKEVITTTVTTTTGWELKDNVWVKTTPVSVTTTDTRPTTAEECPVVVPEKPAPIVQATSSDNKDCASKEVITTTVTTTTGWELVNNVWVKTAPVSVEKVETRPATLQECPAVVPPVVVPPVVAPPVVVPPVVAPPVVVPPVEVSPVVVTPPDNQVIVLGTEATAANSSPVAAAANPLPMAAAAGEAKTNGGQPITGGLMVLAAFIALGAGSRLRRRNREV